MTKIPLLEESPQDFGKVVAESVDAAARRMLRDVNVAELAGGSEYVELHVAIPFTVRYRIGSHEGAEPNPDGPPGTRCCTCTRDGGGRVHCWPSDGGCCP